MNFWDYSVWSFLAQLGILAVTILFANMLRRKIKIIRNSLLPTAVIGGLILFLLKFIPSFDNLINKSFMEMVTYHTLGLGFICMTLKASGVKKDKNKLIIVDTGLITVNTYLIQGIIGLGLTVLLSTTVIKSLYPASGLLLPLGFGQGPGQALNFGGVYEDAGFVGGKSFGLAIAAVGFLFACIGGVIYLNLLNRKNKLVRISNNEEDGFISMQEVSSPNEIPLADSVDKFTMQIAIVLSIYFITYLFMYFTSMLSEQYLGDFGKNTLKPLIWGFNFMFGVLFAVLAKKLMNFLKKTK